MKRASLSVVLVVVGFAAGWFGSRFLGSSQAPLQPADAARLDDLIAVEAPMRGSTITSPLYITGEARGSWYFEGSFPVELIGANGAVLAQKPAHAQGDWMTNDYVPFQAELDFALPTTSESATLVLKKDNPSGLPQNDAQLIIPVIIHP